LENVGSAEDLYALKGSTLYRINSDNGISPVSLGATWTGWKALAGLESSTDKLYVVKGSDLWQVSPSSGSATQVVTNEFPGTVSMTALRNDLYMIKDNNTLKRFQVSTGTMHTVATGSYGSGATLLAPREWQTEDDGQCRHISPGVCQ
jgi:hypothetical protein